MKRIATAFASLLAGAVIYLLYRPTNLIGFHLLNKLGFADLVQQIRSMSDGVQLPDFFVYCLPNGLWSISYILLIDSVFFSTSPRNRVFWSSIIPLIGVVTELMQAVGWVRGTYDIGDLICYSIPFLIYIFYINGSIK